MKFLTVTSLVILAAGAHADVTDIDDPATVTHLRAIHVALGVASSAITACVSDGGDHDDCLCEHVDLIDEFQAAVHALLDERPEITDYGTVNFRDQDGASVAQNISAIIRQAENPPACE